MQIESWSDELHGAVVRRYAELLKDNSIYWEAAQATSGLRVYCDLGGCLVIHATGRVTIFDPEMMDTHRICIERATDNRLFAMISMAQGMEVLA